MLRRVLGSVARPDNMQYVALCYLYQAARVLYMLGHAFLLAALLLAWLDLPSWNIIAFALNQLHQEYIFNMLL